MTSDTLPSPTKVALHDFVTGDLPRPSMDRADKILPVEKLLLGPGLAVVSHDHLRQVVAAVAAVLAPPSF